MDLIQETLWVKEASLNITVLRDPLLDSEADPLRPLTDHAHDLVLGLLVTPGVGPALHSSNMTLATVHVPAQGVRIICQRQLEACLIIVTSAK